MKRILALVALASIIVMALSSYGAFGAPEKLTVAVGTVEGKAGQSVSVPVSISGNSGLVQFYSELSYDSARLTLESVTNGTVLTDPAHGNDPARVPFPLNWDMSTAPKNNTANGTIVTLNFTIKADAEPGDIAITVAPTFVSDFDLNPVAFETVGGKVTVAADRNEWQASDNASAPRGTIDVPVSQSDKKAPWDKLTIQNTDDKNITAEQTEEGLLIRGDDLSEVSASIQKGEQEAAIPIDTANHEVLIKENENGYVAVYVDADGDGVFETELARAAFADMPKSKLPLIIIAAISAVAVIAFVLCRCFKRKNTDKPEPNTAE